jgi:anti-sigma factor RsiW
VSDPDREIGEDDLHAFVDGQLAPGRQALVQQYLHANPGEAQRVAAYRAQRNQLRALFAASASEQLPPKLQIDYILKHRARRSWTAWRVAAAIMLAAGLGMATGWVIWAPARPGLPKLAMQVLVEQAVATYAVYAPDERHAVEVSAEDEAHLTRWLSERLNRTVTVPDLSKFGYTLLGGRLLATERGGASALLMYSNPQGGRISLLLRPMVPGLSITDHDFAEGRLQLCAWIKKGMGYAVVASVPKAELDMMADHIRDEL